MKSLIGKMLTFHPTQVNQLVSYLWIW